MKTATSLKGLFVALFLLTPLLGAPDAGAQTLHVVNQAGFSFSPADLTIKSGDTVRWVWSSGVHTVTEGDDGVFNGNEAFHSNLTSAVSTYDVTFDSAFLVASPRPGNVYQYFCVPHFALNMKGKITVVTPWTDLGFALPGAAGNPVLAGSGDLYGGTPGSLNLSNANAGSLTVLFISFGGNTPVPFVGGTLAAFPVTTQLVLFTSGAGAINLPFLFPSGVPVGSQIVFQYGIADPGATQGAALSNAVRAVTP